MPPDNNYANTTSTVENWSNRSHTAYGVTRRTGHAPGIIQTPVAGPRGTPAVFVRVHAPMETEIVTWTAESEGGPPLVPSPFGKDSPLGLNENMILLDWNVGVVTPVPLTVGGHKWVVGGTAVYGKVVPEGPVQDLKAGHWPYELNSASDNYFPKENFRIGIVDDTLAPATRQELPAPPLQDPIILVLDPDPNRGP